MRIITPALLTMIYLHFATLAKEIHNVGNW